MDYEKLHKEHIEGLTIKELANKYDTRYGNIYYYFKNHNWKILKGTEEQNTRHRINHDYFDKIDTHEKAYFLGLLMADGYITNFKNPKVCLKLHQEDKYLVEALRDAIAPQNKLYKDVNSWQMQIGSRRLVESLIKLGINYRKTEAGENIPDIEQQFMCSFILGFFDGDGSISLSKRNRSTIYICSIHMNFVLALKEVLDNEGINTSIYTENREHLNYKTMYRLGIRDRVKFKNYIYSESNIFMLRKKAKFNNVNTVLNKRSKELLSV